MSDPAAPDDAFAERLRAAFAADEPPPARRLVPTHALGHPIHAGWHPTGNLFEGPYGERLHELTKEPTP